MNSRQLWRELDQKWEQAEDRIERGIEENRKGTAVLFVRDPSGRPIPNVRLEIGQVKQDFLFGCNSFMLDGFKDSAENAEYRSRFVHLFNGTVVPVFWADLEPEEGKPRYARSSPFRYRRPPVETVLDFCDENHLTPKGHALVWHKLLPRWAARDGEEMMEQLDRRMEELGGRYRRRIPFWDVVNESLIDRQISRGYVMPRDYVFRSFQCAGRYFPNVTRFLNEDTQTAWNPQREHSAFSLMIENLLLRGAPIGGIGMQFHLFFRREELAEQAMGYLDPFQLFASLDSMARFRLPVHISEVTLPSYDGREGGLERQALFAERLCRLWFSHPAVQGVIWWNLMDGYAWKQPGWDEDYYGGGLLNRDFSPKPAYEVLENLFLHQWQTRVSARTDAEGRLFFRGYYGGYQMKICPEDGRRTIQEAQFQLTPEGSREIEIEIQHGTQD